MAASPKYKVHNPEGEYVASCRYAEDAALVAGGYGEGAKIKANGRIVWREGAEEVWAGDSVDNAAKIIHEREGIQRVTAFSRAQRLRGLPPHVTEAIPDDPFGDLPGSGRLG